MTTNRKTKLTLLTLITTAALVAPVATSATADAVTGSTGATATDAASTGTRLRAVLQRDTDALLPQGAPGALTHLDTTRGDIRVRSGYADVDARTPVAWNTHFRVGSFTKPFVATTVLQLVGEGKVSLDAPVERYLPGVVRGNGNDGRKVTVRQLLQHTSGLPEYLLAFPWVFDREEFEKHRFDTITARQAVAAAMQSPPDFAPGTSWNYSNTNYMLAGLIIEKVTGRTWQTEVTRRIVRPLGLHDTWTPGTNPDLPDPHAVGYERFPLPGTSEDDPEYGPVIDATRQNPSWGGAAGEIVSTTDDANRFLRALVTGRLLKPAQLREMQRTVPTSDRFRSNWPGARYGLGLMWIPNSCGGSWSHGGDIMGYRTRNGVTPDGSRAVTVTMNTDSTVPVPGAPKVEGDITLKLVDHALCG